jgi:catechol 2,3-dioxygenase-like lactoylglutathione lyase family enzyme
MKMLADTPLVAFLATRQSDHARAFYEGVLGLEVVDDSPFALVLRAAGTLLRIQKVEAFAPHPFTALGWKVDDIARDVAALTERGVRFERFGFLEQDQAGVWTTPDGSKVAWFKDPDGNTLALTQYAAGALPVSASRSLP